MGARSWPFAVGLVQAAFVQGWDGDGRSPGDGSAGRLAVSVAAYHAGFYLLDVVEVDASTGVTAGDMARLWSLAVRTYAEAVFVLGMDEDGHTVLDPMADELRLVVRLVPAGDGDSWPAGLDQCEGTTATGTDVKGA